MIVLRAHGSLILMSYKHLRSMIAAKRKLAKKAAKYSYLVQHLGKRRKKGRDKNEISSSIDQTEELTARLPRGTALISDIFVRTLKVKLYVFADN